MSLLTKEIYMKAKFREQSCDERNAFRAGYRHGQLVSPREAEQFMRTLPNPIPVNSMTVVCFCEGAEDGANKDDWRYNLSWLASK